MNRAELRRLLTVALPCAFALGLVGALIATVLEAEPAVAPEEQMLPRAGRDHWHAAYEIYLCGQLQPPAPFWSGGVHTHDDGIIHIHPLQAFEEGRGARLVKWFEYGGGLLTLDELRVPGQTQTIRNGFSCPDGQPGLIQVSVNGERLRDWTEYVPQDGDRIVISFGPQPDA
jgi:hypothetical protein